MAEHDPIEEERPPQGGSRFRRLGRRILGDGEGRALHIDARDVVHAFLEGGDKAKTEIVKAIAREVRTYLEELGLKDDVQHLLTNYSFEVRASINLRKLAESEKGPAAGGPTPQV